MMASHEHEAKAEPPPSSSSSSSNTAEAKTETRPSVETDMSTNSTTIPSTSWLTPKMLLAMFCVMSLINYLDRGAIASNGVNGSRGTCTNGTCSSGTGIQGDFNLSNFEDGVLSSTFMVGLLVASPIFASLAKSVNPFRLIGVGLSIWTIAAIGCGFSFNFWSIAVCRMLVGVGEASFISLAAPFIDDSAPPAQKTRWLAIFYMCIPAGYAIGYVYGGLVGNHFGWRCAFWVEAALMLPFAILGFTLKPLQMKGMAPGGSTKVLAADTVVPGVQDVEASNSKDESVSSSAEVGDKISHEPSKSKSGTPAISDQFSQFFQDMKELLLDKIFVVTVLGYIAYNFVIGAYSYWGPKAGYSIYHMTNADMIFGGITVVCGILGTLAGGFALDFMTNSLSNAFKLLSLTTLVGGAFCFGAFLFRSQYGFLTLFAIGELLVFATQGPVNYVCLHCVKPSLRPLSMAMSTVAIHIFGDVPSSPLVGVLQDRINNWRTTALILSTIFFPAAAIWFVGIFMHSVDRYNEDSEPQSQLQPQPQSQPQPSMDERKNTTPTPLPEEKTGETPLPTPSVEEKSGETPLTTPSVGEEKTGEKPLPETPLPTPSVEEKSGETPPPPKPQ
ncbi:probable sphingolipid transporter spinster homolog 2 [Arachis duranensis]|uniref:Probable sphingolipid transporter spinster homolog 2 n=1 Tax=Arachis duranensis TaxID=130453 RepID=A0A6P4CRL1_ARADU|nr:probable sphingolipid transporter spinster homolog 2 [Arachis duranensis]